MTREKAIKIADGLTDKFGVKFPVTYGEAYKYRGVGKKTLAIWSEIGFISPGTVGLTTRARNCLSNIGIVTPMDAKLAIESGRLHPFNKFPSFRNYGWGTHQEVCKWAGCKPPIRKTPKCCPYCGEVLP